ncbi:MAG TPA: phosphotransferase [Tepidisphaeraceae bacterium]|nr:phosphotransferase [Tepidisphaeraceae bacterium]
MTSSRPPFPVVESTLASDALAALVQYRYDLAAPIVCTFIKRGTNDTYLITSGDAERSILRVYPHGWRTREQIEEELDSLDHLHAAGLSVSHAIRSRTGDRIQTVTAPEGGRDVVLFSSAPGDFGTFDDAHLFALGKELAELHARSSGMEPLKNRPVLDVSHLLSDPVSRSNSAFLREVMLKIEDAIKGLPRRGPEFGFCHGDFGGFNTHVDGNGRQTHFDFDFCGFGWRAYDLAVFLWSRHKICSSDDAQKHWRIFRQGYESRRKLSEPENRSIPYFVLCREIFIMGVALQNMNRFPRRPNEDPVADCADFVRRWIDDHISAGETLP